VPFEDRIFNGYLEAIVHAYEHFFLHYKSGDLLVMDTSEIDFVDRSEHLQELLQRLSQPVKRTQYFCRLDPRPGTETVVSDWWREIRV
jgi:deoxyadenosine/deoxycytidine kinase